VKRVEIVANRSVQEDLMEALAETDAAKHYTLIPAAHGAGRHGARTGEPAWPEENFILFTYCQEEEAQAISQVVARIKEAFPEEGIKYFELG